MTVTAQTIDPNQTYVTDDVSVDFAVPSRMAFTDDSHIIVYLIKVSDESGKKQALGTDYTLTGAGIAAGGTVTFNTTPPSATYSLIRIERWVKAEQQTDYVEGDKFPAETHEGILDNIVRMIQQLMGRTGGQDFNLAASIGTFLGLTSTLASWDAKSKKIANLLPGTSDTDAANVRQIQDLISNAGNVPAPVLGDVGKRLEATAANAFGWESADADIFPTPANPGDDDKFLAASAAAYTLRTAAQVRTLLGLGTVYEFNVGTGNDNIVQLDDAAKLPAVDGSALTNLPSVGVPLANVVTIEDQKPKGTDGVLLVGGGWRTLDVNTIVFDIGNLATVASDQITLNAGTYMVICQAPIRDVNGPPSQFVALEQWQPRVRMRLYNVTDSTALLTGLNSTSSGTNLSCTGVITIGASKAIEIQVYVYGTLFPCKAGAPSGDVERYLQVTFTKLNV